MVLQIKISSSGDPLILGRPWLSTIDSYIGCRSGRMTISGGYTTKNLDLYPPSKPSFEFENPLESKFEL